MVPTDLPRLPPRRPNAHKGDFGHVLVVGGSQGMSGAACLAGMAALRAGAGRVTVACPASVQPIVAGADPCLMTWGWPHDWRDAAAEVITLAGRCTCLALGPGLGRTDAIHDFVLTLYREVQVPMVVDADALIALASAPSGIPPRTAPTVLTPHPGEFRALVHEPQLTVDACRQRAPGWAGQAGVVMVLKGQNSLITDGTRTVMNPTGNPGMATGGTGDVLTGIVGALMAQSLSAWDAARLAAFVHGLAGDLAAKALGEVSLIARDLIRYLPGAFQPVLGPPVPAHGEGSAPTGRSEDAAP